MSDKDKNYWCFRIDTRQIEYLTRELTNHRQLRQGWGSHPDQDLRGSSYDRGAKRNKVMFDRVKKGDLLLVPHVPRRGSVALVRATQDWNVGYDFRIDSRHGDYGHIFPAEYIKRFTRKNEHVTGNLRSTLRNPSRFWNINHYGSDVETLLLADENELTKAQDVESRVDGLVSEVFSELFDRELFKKNLIEKFNEQFTQEEWEFALVDGLRRLFPFYQVERVGGPEEQAHGTDILVVMPGLFSDRNYAIAIQVKDYEGFVGGGVLDQIRKADGYWEEQNDYKLVDKWVIITRGPREANAALREAAGEDVKLMFAEDLADLLRDIGRAALPSFRTGE